MSTITAEQGIKLDELEKQLVAKFQRSQKHSKERIEEKQNFFNQ